MDLRCHDFLKGCYTADPAMAVAHAGLMRALAEALRSAAWLTRDRARAYARILLAVPILLFAASIHWRGQALPIAHDFAAFWTAAMLAIHGQAVLAYGDAARGAMAALFGPGYYPPFFYSPVALLFWLPFGWLPAATAAAWWIASTAGAYALTLRAMLRGTRFGDQLVVSLAYPAALVCALYGQNGLFSAALFGGIALTLERSPLTAGMLIGCLAYKPQMGVLIPLALACAGRWRAFAAAACTVVALVGASTLAFGPEIWAAFLLSLPVAKAWNASGVPGFDRFASPYAAARLLGATQAAGWLLQAAFALPACACLVWVARRRPGAGAEIAMLVVATCFCVPFLGEYDLSILAVAGAWLVANAARNGWLPYEKSAISLLYLSPLFIKAASLHGIPLAPAAMTLLGALTLRRCEEQAVLFKK